MFDNFAPDDCKNNPKSGLNGPANNSSELSKGVNTWLKAHATFSGPCFLVPGIPGLNSWWPCGEMGFEELAKRWLPLLNEFEENGVAVCYEIHPGKTSHDGVTFERFLKATGNHKAVNILYDPSHFVLQQLDYIRYIDHYHEFIKAFHVKDSEFNPDGKRGVLGLQRLEGSCRTLSLLGDGQIDYKTVFSKLTEYGCDVWAVMEWECVIKSPGTRGPRRRQIHQRPHHRSHTKRFDDFAGAAIDEENWKKTRTLKSHIMKKLDPFCTLTVLCCL